jgi:hypothetical protein
MRNKKYLAIGIIMMVLGIGIGLSDKVIPEIEKGDEYSKMVGKLNELPNFISDKTERDKVDKKITAIGFDVSLYRNIKKYEYAKAMAYRGAGGGLATIVGIIVVLMVFHDNRKCA